MGKNILLTGGIGTGKSSCAKLFEMVGVPVFYDDRVGKELSDSDPEVVAQVIDLLGSEAYSKGKMNRKWIGEQVFTNQSLLTKLSEIIHPAVQRAYKNWVQIHFNTLYTIRESALANVNHFAFDAVVAISAPLELRIQRIIKRDGLDRAAVLNRINKQVEQSVREREADFIIHCDDKNLVIPQILAIHKQFSEL